MMVRLNYGWLKLELKNDAKSGGAICPSVVAIERVNSSLTNLNQLDFRVIFDEAVIGVDVMDFTLNATVNDASIIRVIGNYRTIGFKRG